MDVNNKIKEWLKTQGYELGILGTAVFSGSDCVLVKPDWCPIDGSHTIVVTPHTVVSMVKPVPYNFTVWSEFRRWNYTNKEELKEVLDVACYGCW